MTHDQFVFMVGATVGTILDRVVRETMGRYIVWKIGRDLQRAHERMSACPEHRPVPVKNAYVYDKCERCWAIRMGPREEWLPSVLSMQAEDDASRRSIH